MKIAYLILAHNDIEHLERLTKKIKRDEDGVFIHIDRKSKYKNYKVKNANTISKYKIYWGGYSIVKATIELLRIAYKKGYDYYILLSGDSYPIEDLNELKIYLEDNREINFIDIRPMPSETKSIERLTKYYIEGGNRITNIVGIIKRVLNIILKKISIERNYRKVLKEYNIYSGAQWFALNNEFINYFFDFFDNNKRFVDFFKFTKIPDEMFFQIIIMNSKFRNNIKDNLMYTDWKIGKAPFPAKLEEIHINDFKNRTEKKFFARKINSTNIELFDKKK